MIEMAQGGMMPLEELKNKKMGKDMTSTFAQRSERGKNSQYFWVHECEAQDGKQGVQEVRMESLSGVRA